MLYVFIPELPLYIISISHIHSSSVVQSRRPSSLTVNHLFSFTRVSFAVEFGHLLHVYPDALVVKQHEVHCLDGGGHGGHEVAGDGLQDELSGLLLREAVPAAADGGERHRPQLLLVRQSQAVLDGFLQHLLTLV